MVHITNLSNKVCTFLDKFALWLLIELVIELSLEFFEFHDFCMLRCFDAVKCRKLVVSLRGELRLYVLHKAIKFFDPLLLGLLNLFNRSLYLADIVLEVS